MKRILWIVGPVAVLIVTLSLVALPSRPRWTTASATAAEEFEAALEAQTKLYELDAVRHLESAVQLDPEFVAAKLELALSLRMSAPDRARGLLASVLEAEVSDLQPLERLGVERARAYAADQSQEADRLLDEYLRRYPNDTHALRTKAGALMSRGRSEAAERLYRRLIELSPNWVLGYNQLGYIAMAEGRFAEAEEYFTSYRFIAPDQANPHDSLGELFLILGRYEEAESCFEAALTIKGNFWESYEHLVMARTMRGDDPGTDQLVDEVEAEGRLDESSVTALRCSARMWRLMREQAWQRVLQSVEQDPSCLDSPLVGGVGLLATHRAACREGDVELALDLERRFADSFGDRRPGADGAQPAELVHMCGLRLALSDRLDEAMQKVAAADRQVDYGDAGSGLFKLYNRLLLVEVLEALGRPSDADALLAKVAKVNPVLAADFERSAFRISGL